MRVDGNYTAYQGTREDQKRLNAFYTPQRLTRKMVNMAGNLVGKKVLDNSCGTGNILMEVLEAKVTAGEKPIDAILEIYGVEVDEKTHKLCIERLIKWAVANGVPSATAERILSRHIVCKDALTYDYSFGEGFRFGGISI